MPLPAKTKKPKPTESDDSAKENFRLTNVEVRCARAIGPFLFVRAAVSVTVLKGADRKAAKEFATEECKATMDLMEAKELMRGKQKIEFDADDDIPMDTRCSKCGISTTGADLCDKCENSENSLIDSL